MIRDCNTCINHEQGQRPQPGCRTCLTAPEILPLWSPMSKSYDEAFRGPVVSVGAAVPSKFPTITEPMLPVKQSAFAVQVGGSHYKDMKIQPIEFAVANKCDPFQTNILKYITRRKGDQAKRLEDLRKAQHYIEMYIEAVAKGDLE